MNVPKILWEKAGDIIEQGGIPKVNMGMVTGEVEPPIPSVPDLIYIFSVLAIQKVV